MNNITITITKSDSGYVSSPKTAHAGMQFDENNCKLTFVRPPEMENANLVLRVNSTNNVHATNANTPNAHAHGITKYEPVILGSKNEFVLPKSVTQELRLRVQPVFITDEAQTNATPITLSLEPSISLGHVPIVRPKKGGTDESANSPILEMYIGEIGKQDGSATQYGVFLRIPTPELIQNGDVVYFRHRADRHTMSRNSHTRQGNTHLMRVINNENHAAPGHNAWFDAYPPITDINTLSVKSGDAYKWVKVREVPHHYEKGQSGLLQYKPTIIKVSLSSYRQYFAGNHNKRTSVDQSQWRNEDVSGRFHAFAVMDAVIMRDKTVIAQSQQYLLNCYAWYPHNSQWKPIYPYIMFHMTWREI